MDELYILGCLFLVFALVVAPVLAVIGFNRSTAARQEIARLRQRIEALEQRGVPEKRGTGAAAGNRASGGGRSRACRPLAFRYSRSRGRTRSGPDACGKTAFCLWRHPDVAGALVYAG
jgi:hypothetical protein